jgi:hypothetical protein
MTGKGAQTIFIILRNSNSQVENTDPKRGGLSTRRTNFNDKVWGNLSNFGQLLVKYNVFVEPDVT